MLSLLSQGRLVTMPDYTLGRQEDAQEYMVAVLGSLQDMGIGQHLETEVVTRIRCHSCTGSLVQTCTHDVHPSAGHWDGQSENGCCRHDQTRGNLVCMRKLQLRKLPPGATLSPSCQAPSLLQLIRFTNDEYGHQEC